MIEEKQNKEVIKKMNKIMASSEEISENTGVEVHKQGEQIKRIEEDLSDLKRETDKAEKSTKRITSFWYWVKDGVKNYIKGGKEKLATNDKKNE